MTTWLERGTVFISQLEIPADADAKACRKIFRANGWRFHDGTYWGRRAWGKATRKYLIARGLVEAPKLPIEALAADIIFPFRQERPAS